MKLEKRRRQSFTVFEVLLIWYQMMNEHVKTLIDNLRSHSFNKRIYHLSPSIICQSSTVHWEVTISPFINDKSIWYFIFTLHMIKFYSIWFRDVYFTFLNILIPMKKLCWNLWLVNRNSNYPYDNNSYLLKYSRL